MKIYKTVILLFAIMLLVISCEDVIVENIEDEEVLLLTPKDNVVTSDSTLTFWWEPVEGALEYNFTIVSPDLSNPDYLIVDTLISKNNYSLTLYQGKFQWCVSATNGGYTTDLSCRSLEIHE